MLAWRPGELTRRYIAGERARVISPIALYLFSVFLMFAVLNLTGVLDSKAPGGIDGNLGIAVREQKADIAKLEKQRAANAAAGALVTDLDRKIASGKVDLVQLEKVRRGDLRRGQVSMTRRRRGCAMWSERRKRTPNWWSTKCRMRPRSSAGC